ncbi:MAG: DUF4442 domain-containing protein [Oligoflexales bacterium]|nr:DUF4442 domain-containing protein [Oligoflexales bacterium]
MSRTTKKHLIAHYWDILNKLYFGRSLYSFLLGKFVPYSGSIPFFVEELRPGYAKVAMRDCRKVRNHLKSIHAMALMNLAEISGGLALHAGMDEHTRGILKSLSINFLHKARGDTFAVCETEIRDYSSKKDVSLVIKIFSKEKEDAVAEAVALWLVGPIKS